MYFNSSDTFLKTKLIFRVNLFTGLLLSLMINTECFSQKPKPTVIDVFFVGGQSNAKKQFANGIVKGLTQLNRYQKIKIVYINHSGRGLNNWWNIQQNKPGEYYKTDFFNADFPAPVKSQVDKDTSGRLISYNTEGALKMALDSIVSEGNAYRISGIFWFQGESDAPAVLPEKDIDYFRKNYEFPLNSMFQAISNQFNQGKQIPFAIARIAVGPGKSSKNPNQVINYKYISQVQQELADSSPVGAALDTTPYKRTEASDVHVIFSANEPMNLIQLGYDLALKLRKQ